MARIGALPAWEQLTGRAARAPAARGGFDNAVPPVIERFEGGALPPEWMETVAQLATRAGALLKVMEALATQLKANARDNPGDAARCAKLYSRLGVLAPRLQHLQATADLWLQEPIAGQPPLAKWLRGRHPGRPGHAHRPRLPAAARQPAAQPPLEQGARGGGHLGLAHQLRQLRPLPARIRPGV